jgi:hypothetical protein
VARIVEQDVPVFIVYNVSMFPTPEALILVSVLPAERDLDIARLLGWYRIPLRFAPKVVEVDYLAFYQTGTFGVQHRWKVEYIAPLRGHELVTRRELFRDEPDHPRADEEYYKLQIGSLQALPQPIPAGRWKRVTFLYTTGELLASAQTVNDLVVRREEERTLLWRSLRERALHSGKYQAGELPETALEPALLAMLGALKLAEPHSYYWRQF